MANKKITDATTATSVAGTDKVFLNQGGDLKQVDLNSAVANSQAVQTLNSNLAKSFILPSDLDDDENHIINNCIYICKKVTPLTPFFLIGEQKGKGIFIGFTYDNVPNYACILHAHINSSKFYYCRCCNNAWVIY